MAVVKPCVFRKPAKAKNKKISREEMLRIVSWKKKNVSWALIADRLDKKVLIS
jgi:hypothetical protein